MDDLPEEYRESEVKEAFALFDKNGNGFIEDKEIIEVFRALGQNPTQKEVEELIKKADTVNKDGKIEFAEFCDLMKQIYRSPDARKQSLIDAFKVFDKDGNGYITPDELREILGKWGDEKCTEDEVNEMMAFCDLNNDGRIDLNEFITQMSSKPEPETIEQKQI